MSRPTIFTLRTLLRYDPETGQLFWRARTPDMFPNPWPHTPDDLCRRFNKRYAGKEAFTASRRGYRCGKINRSCQYAHRVIWAMETGEWPAEIDHINGDHADNRITNLRAVSRTINARNQKLRQTNKSGHSGVSLETSGKWRATINDEHGRVYLGLFDTQDKAIEARRTAERAFGYHENHGRNGARHART